MKRGPQPVRLFRNDVGGLGFDTAVIGKAQPETRVITTQDLAEYRLAIEQGPEAVRRKRERDQAMRAAYEEYLRWRHMFYRCPHDDWAVKGLVQAIAEFEKARGEQ